MQDALRIAARGRVAATSDDAASDASGRSEGSSTRRRPEASSSNTSLDSAGAHRAGSVAPFQYPADLDGAQVGQAAETDVNKSCLMVIALYNAAVELEHLSSLPDAVEYYQEALQVRGSAVTWSPVFCTHPLYGAHVAPRTIRRCMVTTTPPPRPRPCFCRSQTSLPMHSFVVHQGCASHPLKHSRCPPPVPVVPIPRWRRRSWGLTMLLWRACPVPWPLPVGRP
jgi:hypothetical protein